MPHCSIQLPDDFCDQLGADMHVHLIEVPNDNPTNIIHRDQKYQVKVHIEMSAQLKRLICGKWCISVAAEGIGPADEPKLNQVIKMDNCHDSMDEAVFDLPGSWFGAGAPGEGCGDVFNLSVTAIALSQCEDSTPLGIAGFCTLGPVMVYG